MRLISHFFRCALAAFALTLATAAQGQAGVSYEPPSVDYAEAPAPPLRSGVADPVAAEPAPPPPEARRGASTRPRIEVGAYLEANVGISADLAGGAPGGEDVVTYTSLAAGVEGTISTRRVQASGAYRYERRFDIEGNIPDEDVHSGIALRRRRARDADRRRGPGDRRHRPRRRRRSLQRLCRPQRLDAGRPGRGQR
jgi:hypothetical protein